MTSTSANANPSALPSTCTSVYDHGRFIQDLIEKFSNKTFTSTLLKNSEHYEITVTQDKQKCKAMIKCQCGTKMILPPRSTTKTFIVSNFYSHLLTTNCSMVQKIKKKEKCMNDKGDQQPLSNACSSKRTNIHIDLCDDNGSSNDKRKRNQKKFYL